jgi:hypothetical protein
MQANLISSNRIYSTLNRPRPAYCRVVALQLDLCGFTRLASSSSPTEVAGIINRLYSDFDDIVMSLGLFKVDTIGDAYVVVGFLADEWNQARASMIRNSSWRGSASSRQLGAFISSSFSKVAAWGSARFTSNPIRSNPIQSDLIRSNLIRSDRI